MNYEPVIGMEVHAELLTVSKMFCGCSAQTFGAMPNTSVCPVCMGLPGSLPVINQRAVELTILTGLALNCKISGWTRWERKNYFYPDLPKGYQISQYAVPLSHAGWIDVETPVGPRRIGIRRAHLEEDTAKLFHVDGVSLVDYNRSGVPLLEIVTESDFTSADEVYAYLTKLRQILRYLGVSTGDMEKGAMRCEPNVSIRPVGQQGYGTKVEIKNLNSIRAVKLALEYEIARQVEVLQAGGEIRQVTMGWDDVRGRTVVQRSKEYAEDYRYFPEPDLPPLAVSQEWIERIRAELPELPEARRARFVTGYGLPPADAETLTADRAIADYYEACVRSAALTPHPPLSLGEGVPEAGVRGVEPRIIANWVAGELFRLMKAAGVEISEAKITPDQLVELLSLVGAGAISGSVGKTVLEEMFANGRSASEIIRERGLTQISDEDRLATIAAQVIQDYPQAVADYLSGKEAAIRFLVGQVMKATKGQANPGLANRLLAEKLQQLK
jgi:aspartyl-tRNA(Asn)/glutamyl-tRNA(Gln) amidotransferase subunit B